jgi:hypothetical protein
MPTAEGTLLRKRKTSDISDRDIARRAFEIYCERGGDHGRDLDDWLQAERELSGPRAVGVA